MEKINHLIAVNMLLKIEVGALRSVLSEFDGDKREYSQMSVADCMEQAVEALELEFKRAQ